MSLQPMNILPILVIPLDDKSDTPLSSHCLNKLSIPLPYTITIYLVDSSPFKPTIAIKYGFSFISLSTVTLAFLIVLI